MSYRDKCEQLYLENQDLKEKLKEAKSKLNDAEFILRTINSEARLLDDYFLKYYGDK